MGPLETAAAGAYNRPTRLGGGVAQLARACGSYPQRRWFESTRRYQILWDPAAAGPAHFPGREGSPLRKVVFGVSGFSAILAGVLTWVLGFLLPSQVSYVTTTVALCLILGGYWTLDPRKRLWSWILTLVGIFLGFYINVISPHFTDPGLLGGISILAAMIGGLVPRKPQPAQGDGAEDPGS